MTEITLRSDIKVELFESSASDEMVAHAAWISSGREMKPGTDLSRLINALLRDRHGTPFEHNLFVFRVEAPIFVFREWWRHRIGVSINEMSGRYTEMRPIFYTPDLDRPLVNTGTQMRPVYERGTTTREELLQFQFEDRYIAQRAWNVYENRLARGFAKEMARTVLPLSLYSEAYWTANARSIMSFLSLRMGVVAAAEMMGGVPAYPSHPQREIEMGAEQVERLFAEKMPLTHLAFVSHGRVAP